MFSLKSLLKQLDVPQLLLQLLCARTNNYRYIFSSKK